MLASVAGGRKMNTNTRRRQPLTDGGGWSPLVRKSVGSFGPAIDGRWTTTPLGFYLLLLALPLSSQCTGYIAIAPPLSTIFKFYISSLLRTIDSPTDDSALEDGQTINAAHGLMTSLQSHTIQPDLSVRTYVWYADCRYLSPLDDNRCTPRAT